MNIDLKQAKKSEGRLFSFTERLKVAPDIVGGDEPVDEFLCRGEYVYLDGRLEISGSGKITLSGKCFRCGIDIVYDINCNLADSIDLDAGDYDVTDDQLDFDMFLREKLVFAQESKRLCREDCKGLCPNCGTNLNIAECSCEHDDVTNPFYALKLGIKNENK